MSNKDIVTIHFKADVAIEQDVLLSADVTREELLEGLKTERFTPNLINGDEDLFEAIITDSQNDNSAVGVVTAQRINQAIYTDFEYVDVIVEDEEDSSEE